MLLLALPLLLLSNSLFPGVRPAVFNITNGCGYTVWPGILSSAGTEALPTTGFSLDPGQSRALTVPASWSGRLWGRTLCANDPSTGQFTCATGDCGSGKIECSGGGAAPPATLAEFTLGSVGDGSGTDFFDVSLVDGYNLPMIVVPESVIIIGNSTAAAASGSGINCTATGCVIDVNSACPSDLKVVVKTDEQRGAVACKSACEAFGAPEYCCIGAYGNPSTCRPSVYSEFFKNACPRAYSYAYDDTTSTFTCAAGENYLITFCPIVSNATQGGMNGTGMVYVGGPELGRADVGVKPVVAWILVALIVFFAISF